MLPHPRTRSALGARGWIALGALCGLAWASALREFMAEVVGHDSGVQWVNTFGFILLPGAAIGALLGWAEHLRRTGGRPGWRLLALAPLLFSAILFSNPFDIGGPLDDGVGGGAIGVPVIAMLGGYALSGRGPAWARSLSGLGFLAGFGTWRRGNRRRRSDVLADHRARTLGKHPHESLLVLFARPRRCRTARPSTDAAASRCLATARATLPLDNVASRAAVGPARPIAR